MVAALTILLAEACHLVVLTMKALRASSHHLREAPMRDLRSRCVVPEACEATAALFALPLNEENSATIRAVKEADTTPVAVALKTAAALTSAEVAVTTIMSEEALGKEEKRAATRLCRSLAEAVVAPVPARWGRSGHTRRTRHLRGPRRCFRRQFDTMEQPAVALCIRCTSCLQT